MERKKLKEEKKAEERRLCPMPSLVDPDAAAPFTQPMLPAFTERIGREVGRLYQEISAVLSRDNKDGNIHANDSTTTIATIKHNRCIVSKGGSISMIQLPLSSPYHYLLSILRDISMKYERRVAENNLIRLSSQMKGELERYVIRACPITIVPLDSFICHTSNFSCTQPSTSTSTGTNRHPHSHTPFLTAFFCCTTGILIF
jgi:hypothetical protein